MVNDGTRRRVRSDETMFDIIEVLRERDGTGVTILAEELEMSKSGVHAHLTSLCDRGYVVNEGANYRLGLQFLSHGIYTRSSHDLYPRANKKVKELAQETDERAWCQVEENGMCYYLCGAEGKHPVHPPVRVGEGVHPHTIAGGKAILAFLPEDRVRAIIDRHGLPRRTKNTITDEGELFDELDEIRERGYALNMEESLDGLNAVGAPIQDAEGHVQGSLSVSGPANRLKDDRLRSELPELLLGATNELEINIFYS